MRQLLRQSGLQLGGGSGGRLQWLRLVAEAGADQSEYSRPEAARRLQRERQALKVRDRVVIVAERALQVLAVHLSNHAQLRMLDAQQLAACDLHGDDEIVGQLIGRHLPTRQRAVLEVVSRSQSLPYAIGV